MALCARERGLELLVVTQVTRAAGVVGGTGGSVVRGPWSVVRGRRCLDLVRGLPVERGTQKGILCPP